MSQRNDAWVFSTKLLQGNLFRKMRDVVLVGAPITTQKTDEELGRVIVTEKNIKEKENVLDLNHRIKKLM